MLVYFLNSSVSLVPLQDRRVVAAGVPVKTHVKHTNQVAFVRHNRALVVFVAHAPDSVLRVVITRQLRLAPEGRAELLRPAAAAENDAKHVVLDVRPQEEEVCWENHGVDRQSVQIVTITSWVWNTLQSISWAKPL